MSVNKVILVGNVGRDPEVRHLETGATKASFTLATSESYKSKTGETIKNTEWHNIVLWRGLADVAEKYVKKGMQLYIEGKITTRSWDDKDGTKKYMTEIVADNMQMLGSRDGGPRDNQSFEKPSTASSGSNSSVEDLPMPTDDLPF